MTEYFAGIDIGSTMTKVVILDEEIMASVIGPTGPEQRHLANRVMQQALNEADLSFDSHALATIFKRFIHQIVGGEGLSQEPFNKKRPL